MHNLSNTCEVAYGTVLYLRFTSTYGNVHCSFLMSKSCLMPLEALSISRLELTVATLVVKLYCNKYKCQIAILHLNKFEGKIVAKGAFFHHCRLITYILPKIASVK